MTGTKHIIKKELTRVFTDKKMVFSLFILPAILIVGMYSLMGTMITNMMKDIEKHIPIVYIQNQPQGFEDYVNRVGFVGKITYFNGEEALAPTQQADGSTTLSVADIKDGILKGSIDTLISFEDNFDELIANYQAGDTIPEVKTFYNPSEDYSNTARSTFVEAVLNPYKEHLLEARIGNLDQIQIFDIDRDQQTSIIVDEDKANGKVLANLLPYLITFLLFTSAMSLGVDAITGEKERGTIASMLITPLKRKEIVMGKLISLSILSSLSAIVYAVSMVIALPMMYKGMMDTGNMSVSFSPIQIVELLAIMVLLVYLYVVVVALVAVYAKTAKEAGTYVTPVMMIVLVAGILTMFQGNSEPSLSMYAIPIYGTAMAIQKLFMNDLSLVQFLLTVLGTVIVSGILTSLVTKAFNSEKVMFNA